jgi:iron(III) transport system ATP-binding protein
VINNFNYQIKKGQIIGVLGESGSGKSTLLRLIAGLESPQRGALKIQDEIIFDQHHFLAPEKRNIGMVFQDYALFPHMSVERNIKYGLSKEVKKDKRVREVLALVNMQGYERRYPHELSGGQQQRIALARAIAPQPELLLLDEPFSSLDFDLQLKIREELKEILKQANMTTILVTHNRENCKSIADEIIELKNGEITNNNWGIA